LTPCGICSSNIELTLSFLQRMFSATVVWDERVGGVRGVRLQLGRAFIHVYDQPPKGPRGGAVHHLRIETDDLAGPDDLLIELFECKEPVRWRIPPTPGS
jgi:hypothetical protein